MLIPRNITRAQLLLVPSAFAVKTGEAHWVAVRTRQLRCFVCLLRLLYHLLSAPAAVIPAADLPLNASFKMQLLRCRAIESQCYVAAAAQCGQHNDGLDGRSGRRR